MKRGSAKDPSNLTPNPFPSGKGNQIVGTRAQSSRVLSYYWVQGSPLPKEV
jgi:hypothetical protein